MITYYESREIPFDSFLSDDLTFPLHLHKQMEIVLVTAGEVTLWIGSHQKHMSEGELALIFPNQVHSYVSEGHSQLLLIIFDPELAGDFTKLLIQKQPRDPFIRKEQIHQDIHFLLPYFKGYRSAPLYRRLLKGYLTVILSRILERTELVASSASPETDLLHHALCYMNLHFTEPLSLDSLSRELGVSKFHLSRCFSEKIGCNFTQYLNSVRINYAKQRLETSGISVSEVAAESGFESQCTFFRSFKLQTGLTPNQYRKNAKE